MVEQQPPADARRETQGWSDDWGETSHSKLAHPETAASDRSTSPTNKT